MRPTRPYPNGLRAAIPNKPRAESPSASRFQSRGEVRHRVFHSLGDKLRPFARGNPCSVKTVNAQHVRRWTGPLACLFENRFTAPT